jgi:hypothetical protein
VSSREFLDGLPQPPPSPHKAIAHSKQSVSAVPLRAKLTKKEDQITEKSREVLELEIEGSDD